MTGSDIRRIEKRIDNLRKIQTWIKSGGVLYDEKGSVYITDDYEEDDWKELSCRALKSVGLNTSLIDLLLDENSDIDVLVQKVEELIQDDLELLGNLKEQRALHEE